MNRIYVASRTHHAELWKAWRAEGHNIISSWIDEAGAGETKDLSELWNRIVNEVRSCNALVIYAGSENDFPLKGAYVEVGVALALNIPVSLVLGSVLTSDMARGLGSWINHPLVSQYNSVGEALKDASEKD